MKIKFFLFSILSIILWSNAIAKTDDKIWQERANDWRNGPIVYQIIVDRFAPSSNLKEKLELYASPKKIHKWNKTPKKGVYSEEAKVWTHEIDFWGGDLKSLKDNLDYIETFGADVVYLNPIFKAFTNHKYDTLDYYEVDPQYGTNKDLKNLANALHKRNMKLVLDGVFNHVGKRSEMFQEALNNPKSKYHNFFKFTDQNKMGYIGWWNVANLPELDFNNKAVQNYIFGTSNSVVQYYLRKIGIDGWRLDVAYDLGPVILSKLTGFAHRAKKESLVMGEIWNYPSAWNSSLDAISNMHGRQIILDLLEGKVTGSEASRMWENMIKDSGLDYILKCWLMLDNHDVPRLPNLLPNLTKQKIARLLQLTLPGAAYLYYGSELGMTGGEDPEQRAPMRWDLVTKNNKMFNFHKKLISIRKANPALRYGDYKTMTSKTAFAFMRMTNKVRETIIVAVNPTNRTIKESLQVKNGWINSWTTFKDQLSNRTAVVKCGMIDLSLKPHDMMILKVDIKPTKDGYDKYDGIK